MKESACPVDDKSLQKEKNGGLLNLPNVNFIRSLSWTNISNFVTKKSSKNMQRELKKAKNGTGDNSERVSVGGMKRYIYHVDI